MLPRTTRPILIVALAGALLPLVAEPSFTIEVPATLHARAAVAPRAPKALPFAATHLGLRWKGGEEAAPEIRTRSDGASWSTWRPLPIAHDLSDEEAGVFYSGLIPGGDARWVEIRPRGPLSSPVLSVINTRDGPPRTVRIARVAHAATPQPHVISRAEWGADESLRKASPSFARVRRLFVHHTVTANDDPDPAGTIRAIYAYHTQFRGWNDIGYNFLIDSNGSVYEGRYARTYDPGELPNGENRNGMGVVGAHVAGFNTGSAGVALLGDFSSASPSSTALNGLAELLAWKADRHGIDPLGSSGGIANIAGHRDAGNTSCPGDSLYNSLPAVRSQAEARIQSLTGLTPPAMPAGTELFPSNATTDLTPNASGAVSRTAARVELTFDGTGLLSDRTFSLRPAGGSFTLTDSDYLGLTLRPDRYTVRAIAFDVAGRASPVAPVASGYLVTTGDLPTGYWVMGSDGGVFSFGSAEFHGSTGGMRLNRPVVGMDATPDSKGYWLVASDGGIFAFGDAQFYGSTGGMRLNQPIADLAATPTGRGYWLVASDGGVFAFGDAEFYGSTGAMRLNQPIVGMAPTPTGLGYWLVASDGGIFAFGDARFGGSTGAMRLNQPIVGLAPTPTGGGYWLVAADGGIFAFGDAEYFGSIPGRGVRTSVSSLASTGTGNGYYALSAGGGIYAFGDAPLYGSPYSSGLRITALDMAPAR